MFGFPAFLHKKIRGVSEKQIITSINAKLLIQSWKNTILF